MFITNKRFAYIDVLRLVAISLVILLHSSSDFVWNFSNSSIWNWLIVDAFHSLSIVGVPIFVMISGMLLLSRNRDIPFGDFFKKQFLKVFIPFFIWSIFYIFYSHDFQMDKISFEMILSPAYYHLWFVYMLLGIYLLFPILRTAFGENVKSFQYEYFLIIWFLFFSFIPLCLKSAGIEMPSIWFLRENIIFFLGYFALAFSGYFVLGYYLENIKMETAKKKIIYWLSIISFFATLLGTYFLTMKNGGNLDNYLYSELSPNIIIMSVGFFVWFRDINWDKILSKKLLSALEGFGLICYGIYLSHPFILDQLRTFEMFKGLSFEWLFLAVFCLIISYVFCLIIGRVKILKNLLISYAYQGKSTIRKD